MPDDIQDPLRINDELAIPVAELEFRASRSSGPGGQHVNKVATRVTLRFDVGASPSLNDDQRRRLLRRLATRISSGGVLALHCGSNRSLNANRREVVERFVELLARALERRRPRRKTRPSKGSVKRRLDAKTRRSRIKSGRRSPSGEE